MRLLLAALFAVFSVTTSHSEVIKNNAGGLIDKFMSRYQTLKDSGERVIFEGYCNSACTLVTHYLPRDRVCVMPGTYFGFHSAFHLDGERRVFSKEATRAMWEMY